MLNTFFGSIYKIIIKKGQHNHHRYHHHESRKYCTPCVQPVPAARLSERHLEAGVENEHPLVRGGRGLGGDSNPQNLSTGELSRTPDWCVR